jgi:signal transduction histidine kinase
MAARLLGAMAREEPVRQVQWDIEPELIVRGDRTMLEVVMANLLANSWKYTARRDNALIRVFARKDEHGLAICVADNGAGFEPSHAGKLFQPFQRLHRQEEFPGIGIGLATVQRIIHRHGGTLEAKGEKDVGAAFCFTLPADDDRNEEVS